MPSMVIAVVIGLIGIAGLVADASMQRELDRSGVVVTAEVVSFHEGHGRSDDSYVVVQLPGVDETVRVDHFRGVPTLGASMAVRYVPGDLDAAAQDGVRVWGAQTVLYAFLVAARAISVVIEARRLRARSRPEPIHRR
ncbi:hypothetical protein [Cellulomonas sp. HZM]|uniref:hypothetical protein n=1 Tax=Cellulomonas sp. HZM TaxID=1454010 RepID=UPI00049344EC|nr:hypothetical protein [Cellulomonas sp. HZM]